MELLLTIVHVFVCLFLIIVVLLQSGKAADLAGAFGGMGSQTAFGPRGAASLLSKATTAAAVIFMLTSIWLGIVRTRGTSDSVIERTGTGETAEPGGTESSGQPPGLETEIEVIPPGDDAATGEGHPDSDRE